LPYIIPEYIEIKTATGDTVAFLSPESDGLKECWIDDEQNGTCTLEIELPLNLKTQSITDFTYAETTQADFNSGTLANVVATSAGDLELATTISSDISTGKESGMSASSMYSSAYSPDNLVDGSIVFGPGTHFGTASGAVFPQWHQIDLGDVFNIDKVRWIDNSTTGRYPKDYTIAISETGAFAGEQTVVVTKTGNTVHKAWVEHTFTTVNGRYVRMTVSASAAGSYYELSEWQVYGSQPKPFGTRIKEVDLSGANPAGGTKIEWSKTTPTDTVVKVEIALSTDGGATYGAYQEATSGSSIPGIASDTNLSTARLKIKETLSTTDTSATPQLHSLSLTTLKLETKWQYLTDKYRIYADGKEFVILNPDAVDKQRDGQKLTGKIKAHESWVLLGKKYQTVSNDPQNPNPPWGAVIIVSGGEAHGGFEAGSAGSALSYLLNGTGWTVGTVDVVGTFDLETEKESVLYNINQVQEKWGGILIWDSINKTVSLRDEEAWQNYTGYQIRYAKNLKGINRVDDYDIVTRLYPFGENDLNIATVNGGLLYLDNQSYSTQVLEGVWYNQDLADQAQLKVQGEKQLAVMCRPRHNYKTEVLDLRSIPGYGHETFKRSDMVDLFDEDFGANARVRIIRYRHNVFQPWLCDMELGDPLEKIAATVAQTVLMAKFYKNVVAPNTSFQNLLKAIINTEATEINGASGDYTLVDGVSTWFDRDEVTGELTGKLLRITPQGLIISYDGGQTWKLAISGEGIHADAGWVGKLNAGVITVGADTTFESGYDPTQITSVGMGVDADCLGLWHFDGSLNNHKGIPAIADANFDTGCFGQAVKVEEGTTNLVTNGNFADGTTGWVSLTSDTDITQTIVTESGKTFNHVVCNITDENVYPGIKQTEIAVSPNTTYTISGLGYSPYEFSNGVLAVFGNVSGALALAGLPTSQGIASFTFTTGADDTSVDIWAAFGEGAVDDYFKVTDIQLEQKDHATPFVNGSRLGVLKVPTTGMSVSAGAINFRAKNLTDSANGSVLFDLGASDGNQAIKVGIADDGKLYVEDKKVEFVVAETSQADFNTGTLTDVQSNATGDLTLGKEGTDFAITDDTQAEFEAGTLINTEYINGVKLKYTPGDLIYGTDFTGGKTYSADSEASVLVVASKAFDDNESSAWRSTNTSFPHWVRVDLGSGITKVARKLRLYAAASLNDFKLQGSNNGTSWTDIYTDSFGSVSGWEEYEFENATAYRYYRVYGINGTANNMSVTEIELMEATETPGTYALSGTWEKEYDLSAVGVARGSMLSWSATTPANTSIQVQVAIATDGINYGSYATCTSGSAIPGITAGMDLSSAKMKVKVTLATSDDSVTPSVSQINIAVNSAYKASGSWQKVYDLSSLGNVGSSVINWTAHASVDTGLFVFSSFSTDGGSTYSTEKICSKNSEIPDLAFVVDTSALKLKIKALLYSESIYKTPTLEILYVHVNNEFNVAYGVNKSTLTAWDNIAIQWKTDRLSLIINGAESAYIENPGQVTTLDTYVYIGSDKAGANQIGTTIDELRIDKVYQPIEKVNAWHIVDAPFYTSEEFKQWPGYVRVETDGLKVYDSEDTLRVLVGSWLRDAVRKYGIKIVDGEIHSSLFRTGSEDALAYIELTAPNILTVYGRYNGTNSVKVLEIIAPDVEYETEGGGAIYFYRYKTTGSGLAGMIGYNNGDINIFSVYGYVKTTDLHVSGNITKTGSYSAVEPTEDYGTRLLYATETPELLYYDRGVTNLINGEAIVKLDPIFLQCIEPDAELTPWQVWVESYGENGVYVAEVGEDYFKVKERNGGGSDNKVIWRLEATRKNYTGIRLMEVVN